MSSSSSLSLAPPSRRRSLRSSSAAQKNDAAGDDDEKQQMKLTDLPQDILVSILSMTAERDDDGEGDEGGESDLSFEARHTLALVCREWSEVVRGRGASPLFDEFAVDFAEEESEAAEAMGGSRSRAFVRASKVLSCARVHAPGIRILRVNGGGGGGGGSSSGGGGVGGGGNNNNDTLRRERFRGFTATDLGELVSVLTTQQQQQQQQGQLRGSAPLSLREIAVDAGAGQLVRAPFWRALRGAVVSAPGGKQLQLRSLVLEGLADAEFAAGESGARGGGGGGGGDVSLSRAAPPPEAAASVSETLARLTSLEDLCVGFDADFRRSGVGLSQAFMESSVRRLSSLTRLRLECHRDIVSLPGAAVAALRALEDLSLRGCSLTSLPREMGDLTRLTRLDVSGNKRLGAAARREARRLAERPRPGLGRGDGDGNDRGGAPPPPPPPPPVFPDELSRMTSLRRLKMRSCGLREVPPFVLDMWRLEQLYLSDNDKLGRSRSGGFWEDVFPDFTPDPSLYRSLTCLELANCGLTSVPYFVTSWMPGLRELYLGGNRLKKLPQEFGQSFPALTRLCLERNEFPRLPPDEFFYDSRPKNLRVLSISAGPGATQPDIDGYNLDSVLHFLPRLRHVECWRAGQPWGREHRRALKWFASALKKRNPGAKVVIDEPGAGRSEAEGESDDDDVDGDDDVDVDCYKKEKDAEWFDHCRRCPGCCYEGDDYYYDEEEFSDEEED